MTGRYPRLAEWLINSVRRSSAIAGYDSQIQHLEEELAGWRIKREEALADRLEQLGLLAELGYAVRQDNGEYIIHTQSATLQNGDPE